MLRNLLVNNVPPDPIPLKAFVSTNEFNEFVPNGSYTTPAFEASAIGGTAPYTFSWELSEGRVNNLSSNRVSCTFSGNRQEIDATLTLTVTDSLSATASTQTLILIQFGGPL